MKKEKLAQRLAELRDKDLEKKKNRLAYMQELIEEEDFHGIADCAMDLRELEQRLVDYSLFEGF